MNMTLLVRVNPERRNSVIWDNRRSTRLGFYALFFFGEYLVVIPTYLYISLFAVRLVSLPAFSWFYLGVYTKFGLHKMRALLSDLGWEKNLRFWIVGAHIDFAFFYTSCIGSHQRFATRWKIVGACPLASSRICRLALLYSAYQSIIVYILLLFERILASKTSFNTMGL